MHTPVCVCTCTMIARVCMMHTCTRRSASFRTPMSRPHELNRSKVTGTKVPQKERRSKSAASSPSEEAGSAVRCKNETRVAGVICRTSAPSPFLMAILDLHQRLASKLEASVCLGVGAAAEASGCCVATRARHRGRSAAGCSRWERLHCGDVWERLNPELRRLFASFSSDPPHFTPHGGRRGEAGLPDLRTLSGNFFVRSDSILRPEIDYFFSRSWNTLFFLPPFFRYARVHTCK